MGPRSSFELKPGESLGYLFRDTYRAYTRSLARRIGPHGISLGQWYFLRVLWEEDGLTQRELSDRVGMMEPTTVSALRVMEKNGLVRRTRDRHDRRRQKVTLTPKGRRLKRKLIPLAAEVNMISSCGLTRRDVETLRRLAKVLKANLEKDKQEV